MDEEAQKTQRNNHKTDTIYWWVIAESREADDNDSEASGANDEVQSPEPGGQVHSAAHAASPHSGQTPLTLPVRS
jgi:hypothetical protein